MFACVDRKGEKGDVGGQASGLKIGQLILSMGPASAEIRILVQGPTIPSKRVIFILVNHHTCITIVYMLAVLCT